jgi:1,4-alpha-glucan branching enzyme
VLLLGPHVPMLFMGEEWGEVRPFGFFTDFHGELADAVREGRRREFRRFAQFADEKNRARIPDPNAMSTFEGSRLDWNRLESEEGRARYDLVRRLLQIRRREIVPRLGATRSYAGAAATIDGCAIGLRWTLGDGAVLTMIANLGDTPAARPIEPAGEVLYESAPGLAADAASALLPSWSVVVSLEKAS